MDTFDIDAFLGIKNCKAMKFNITYFYEIKIKTKNFLSQTKCSPHHILHRCDVIKQYCHIYILVITTATQINMKFGRA